MKNSDYTDDQVTRWRRYIDKCLLLSRKTALIIAGVWVLSMVLHNAIYYLFYEHFSRVGHDERVFFTIAVFVIPLFFIISFVYTVIRKGGQAGEK